MSLIDKILLEETSCTDGGFKRVAENLVNDKKKIGCQVKQCEGKWYFKPDSCKPTPTPTPRKPTPTPTPKKDDPKPEPEKKDITDCKWKPSEGMIFKCNSGCQDMESGDFFRDFVYENFPEVAKSLELNRKGNKILSYCSTNMKNVWEHKYDGKNFPGLKDKTLGSIYIDGLILENSSFNCNPWETGNFFVNDFKEEDRDKRAFEMVRSFNDEYEGLLDSNFLDVCGNLLGDINMKLTWCFEQFPTKLKKDLHKNPVVRWISNTSPGGQLWYDFWKNNILKESKIKKTNLIEQKIKLRKKINEMKNNKNLNKKISESVTKKIKSKKIEKDLKVISEDFEKQNYRKFFTNMFKLKKNNFISEELTSDFDKSFDTIFKGQETEFKNRAIEFILNKLEVDINSELGKEIKSELDSLPAKEIFKNEYDIPEAVYKSIEKIFNLTKKDETGLKGIFSKSIKLDDKQIKQEVRQHLHDYVEGVKSDIKALEQKLKSSILNNV